MVKKEVYLQFDNRNKCITFESKSKISDWDNLRKVMRQVAEKDKDLKRRLQNCNNIIFQKYKVKKSTGERILVDVDEDEESEVEHDADLGVVFCHIGDILEDISKSQASENKIQVQNLSMQSPNTLFLDLSSDLMKCHEISNEIKSHDMNIRNADEIVGTYELIKKNEEKINLKIIDTVTDIVTDAVTNTIIETVTDTDTKPTENSSKRKLNTKIKPERVCGLKSLYFIFVDILCKIVHIFITQVSHLLSKINQF